MGQIAEALLRTPVGVYLGAAVLLLRLVRWPQRYRLLLRDSGIYLLAVVMWGLFARTNFAEYISMADQVVALEKMLNASSVLARDGVPMYALVGPYVLGEILLIMAAVMGVGLAMAIVFAPALAAAYSTLDGALIMRRLGGWFIAAGFMYAWLVTSRLGMEAALSSGDVLAMVTSTAVAVVVGLFIGWINVQLVESFT